MHVSDMVSWRVFNIKVLGGMFWKLWLEEKYKFDHAIALKLKGLSESLALSESD